MAIVARLLLLLSVLLMPLGMVSASTSAPAIDHHAMMVGTTVEHCPDQSNKHERNEGMAICSMACASALPAQQIARDDTALADHQLIAPALSPTLHGIHTEIATPPPKLT